MRYLVVRASIGLSCCLAIGAQTRTSTPHSAGSGVIAGIVLNAADNTPLRRAVVTLSTVETQPQDAVAWTDANGRFSFGYLPAGRYQLRVTKDNYQPAMNTAGNPRRPPAIIQLGAGESRSDFVFHLQLVSSISGVVLDEDGDPLSGVQVRVLRPQFQRGKRRLVSGPIGVTDSAGRYRLSGLVGGQYVVAISGQNRLAIKAQPEAIAGQSPQHYFYGDQFYPAADRAEGATPIQVQPGQETSQVDFRLHALPAVAVEGKIVVPPDAASVKEVTVNIASEGFADRVFGGTGAAPPDYHFVRGQLALGSYVLVAEATVDGKSYRGVQKVDVGPQGAHELAIPLEAGIDLTGSVSIEGPEA